MSVSFLILGLMLTSGILSLALIGRSRQALCYGWIFALFLLPGWVEARIGGSWTLTFPMVAAAAGFTGFVLSPSSAPRVRWSVCDALMLILVGSMLYSQYRSTDYGPSTLPAVLFRWFIPYLVGRHFLGSIRDLVWVERFLACTIVVVACYAVCEMVSKVNPAIMLTGQRFWFLEQESGYRLGMRRAQVMNCHPIVFGLTMVMLLPWALEASRQSRLREAPHWYRVLPLLTVVGAAASLSRGPVLAAILTVAGVAFFRLPRYRVAMVVAVLVVGFFAWTVSDLVIGELSSVVGEYEENAPTIIINGTPEKYTGTRHRILQFKAYNAAIQNTGLFGFGEQMLPVRILYPVHPLFFSIDCQYLLILLQFGWVGLALFVLLGGFTIFRLARIAWRPSESPLAGIAGGLCAAMAAVSVSLLTAYLPSDLGSLWLFTCGLACNLAALDDELRLALDDELRLALDDPHHLQAVGFALDEDIES